MKKEITRLICAAICCTPIIGFAQTGDKFTSTDNLYKEGKELFQEKNYAAALPALKAFVKQKPAASLLQDAEYMLVSSAYELKDKNRIELLRKYLDRYPDTPYANRIYALLASCYFYEVKYDEALALFNSADLDLLGNEERDDCTYQLATCYLKTDNLREAAIWFETWRANSPKYAKDCDYYLSYIRYTQKRYTEALKGFLPLQDDSKYKALVPYYIAEIYTQLKNYDKAQIVAQNYLSAYPNNEHAAEMYRILGDAYYHFGQYHQAVEAFNNYLNKDRSAPRRDALYMLGLSYYQTKVYSKAAETLGKVTTDNDALTQNAYLHMGLSYLQLAEKNKARMAFEQAAASNANMQIKEQAAYNYALCLHETSFSAFGESVTAFEKFLNEFPTSPYAEKVSSYLVEVYMNTRSYDAALKSIDRIAKPSAQILEAKQKILFQLGTQSFANADFEQALKYLNQSIAIGQYNRQTKADAYYWCGESYYRLSRMVEAARDFNAYLQLTTQPNNEMYALANYNLGYIAFHRKDYTQASNYFQKYVQLEKGENATALADAYNRIGDCHLHVRNFEEAKQYYSQAEQMNTSSGDYSFYQLALVSGLQKDYTGKITLLNRLVGKYPASPYAVNAIYEKGRSYVLMDNNNQAITSFKELLTKYPESPVSRKAAAEIGLLYYQKGDYNQAIEAYKQVIEKYPGSEEARLAMRDLKSIYVDLNRIDEFAALANAMPGHIRFDANEQDSLTYAAAEKIYARGRMEEAKTSLNKYLQTFPEGAFSLNAHYYLCLIGNEQKNYDMILLHSGKLLEYPNNPFAEEALILRAEVQFNQQNMAEALASYKMLKEKATNVERRQLAETGILRCAFLLRDDGLIPLGRKPDKELLDRYQYLQKFLKESKEFGAQRQESEKKAVNIALQNLARNSGYGDVTRLTWSMETELIKELLPYLSPKEIDGVEVYVQINEEGKSEIKQIKDGKELNSMPAKLKKHPYIEELKAVHKKLKDQYTRSRIMLEQAMEDCTHFEENELRKLMQNPVIWPLLKHLVFICNGQTGFYTDGLLITVNAVCLPLKPKDELRIAHPTDLYTSGDWHAYQKFLFDKSIRQPFKQVFRELYVPTPEEIEATQSRRYAGNQIQPQKTVAVLKGRRWVADYEDGLQKIYYKENIIATIYAMADWFSPADIEAPTLEYVCFHNRKDYKLMKISEIPPVIFSEVMRDVDLAVSVAHAGSVDPETSHSTIEMRSVLVELTMPLFHFKNVTIKGSFAHIEGKLGKYNIHLGSGVIHQEGGAQIAVLPVHSQNRGRLFLPFVDEDPKTAEILTKIIFFAEDDKIKDPSILNQIK